MAIGSITAKVNLAVQPLITECQAGGGTAMSLNLNELQAALTALAATITTMLTQSNAHPG